MVYLQIRQITMYPKEVSLSVNMKIDFVPCLLHMLLKQLDCCTLDLADGYNERATNRSR